MNYEPMSTDAEMSCMIAADLEPTDAEMSCMIAADLEPTDAEMRESVYHPEEIDSDDEIPPPPPLPRQAAVAAPIGYGGMSLRDQEIRYIQEHGLVAFCHGSLFTAIILDADYLRAQLVFLGK
jgi:hypothetical protein